MYLLKHVTADRTTWFDMDRIVFIEYDSDTDNLFLEDGPLFDNVTTFAAAETIANGLIHQDDWIKDSVNEKWVRKSSIAGYVWIAANDDVRIKRMSGDISASLGTAATEQAALDLIRESIVSNTAI